MKKTKPAPKRVLARALAEEIRLEEATTVCGSVGPTIVEVGSPVGRDFTNLQGDNDGPLGY